MLDEALKVAVADLERNVFAGLGNHTDATIRASEKAESAPSASTNTGSPTIARRIQLLLDEWDNYAPDQKAVLADILRELQRAGA
jgi:hypothetical protein